MRRCIHLACAWVGIAAGHLWTPRASLQLIRAHGWRSHLAVMASLAQLIANLGVSEAVKMARLVCSISMELCPDHFVACEMMRVAALGSATLKPRQITPILYRMARKIAAWHPHGVTVNG